MGYTRIEPKSSLTPLRCVLIFLVALAASFYFMWPNETVPEGGNDKPLSQSSVGLLMQDVGVNTPPPETAQAVEKSRVDSETQETPRYGANAFVAGGQFFADGCRILYRSPPTHSEWYALVQGAGTSDPCNYTDSARWMLGGMSPEIFFLLHERNNLSSDAAEILSFKESGLWKTSDFEALIHLRLEGAASAILYLILKKAGSPRAETLAGRSDENIDRDALRHLLRTGKCHYMVYRDVGDLLAPQLNELCHQANP